MENQVVELKITDMIDRLLKTHDELDRGEIEVSIAKEKTNIAGKIAKLFALNLTYNMYMGIKKPIAFLEQPKSQTKLMRLDEVEEVE